MAGTDAFASIANARDVVHTKSLFDSIGDATTLGTTTATANEGPRRAAVTSEHGSGASGGLRETFSDGSAGISSGNGDLTFVRSVKTHTIRDIPHTHDHDDDHTHDHDNDHTHDHTHEDPAPLKNNSNFVSGDNSQLGTDIRAAGASRIPDSFVVPSVHNENPINQRQVC